MAVLLIKKRDGSIVKFEPAKIAAAIHKAILSVKHSDGELAKKLAKEVVAVVEKHFPSRKKVIPGVEDVQDIVEEALIKNKLADVAKSFILYREKRKEEREAKLVFGVRDDLKLGANAIQVLAKRYLLRDETGKIIETPKQLFRRVARAVASVDARFGDSPHKSEDEFYQMMASREFIPNTPTLMNAGTKLGQLSACFVLPVGDSLREIFRSVSDMAIIQQSGGGTGFSFTQLRPKGDIVRSTKGVASGPVSFIRIFDLVTDVIKQGGKRRGANMGILNAEHPDIIEFCSVKSNPEMLANFNISVGATEKFMQAVAKNRDWELINPHTGKVVMTIKARQLFELIVSNAWRTGDPGMIFLDEINRHNPTPKIGRIESTNPCGEQPLLAYESCNLGSINLAKMVAGEIGRAKMDWDKLRDTIRKAVHFLDNVIDANKFPLPEIEKMTKDNRKIGLGVMGFAEALIRMGVRYDSSGAIRFAERLMKFIKEESHKKSIEIGKKRGSFPNFKGSVYDKNRKQYPAMRNSTVTTIAPTGTISIIAGATSGIEPLFAVSFVRDVLEHTRLLEVNPEFEEIARQRGFYSKALMMKIARKGSLQHIKEIPADVRRLFVTAFDIKPEWHVKMQAAFQKHTDNAVSKTINLPEDAAADEVKKAFLLAWKLKCKGITVYRYGSKPEQVLYIGKLPEEYTRAESEFAGGCPGPVCPF